MLAHCNINFAFFSTPLYVQKVATPPTTRSQALPGSNWQKVATPLSVFPQKGYPLCPPRPPKWLPLNLNPPPKGLPPINPKKGYPPPNLKTGYPPPNLKKGYPPQYHGIDLRKSGHPPTILPNKAQKSPSFEGLSDKGATPSTSRLGNV